jgi:D-alanyl-D-alanine carboxypeptidase
MAHPMPKRRAPLAITAVAIAAILQALPAGAAPTGAPARPAWKVEIDHLVAGLHVGVSVREEGAFLYRHADVKRRAPGSNEKLLLAMALLDRAPLDLHVETLARAAVVKPGGIVPGNLWLLGRGDPHVGPSKLGKLAERIADAGITRIKGSVRGATTYFAHDWNAPGWKPYFPEQEIPLPTALTYKGNVAGGKHIRDPERRAARELAQRLRGLGIPVAKKAGAGTPPDGLDRIAEVRSPPLIVLLQNMLRPSNNFAAEVLGKLLGVLRQGRPGTIHKGAAAIRAWAASEGVQVVAHDGSGLSYWNRVAPRGMVRLLDEVEDMPWGEALRDALPGPGQGTLGGRLAGVPVKAKTGTLTERSALSGWILLQETGTWAEFSIISKGLPTQRAKDLEDKIVRILWKDAE